jgi:membrane-bound ClpP family serine protease
VTDVHGGGGRSDHPDAIDKVDLRARMAAAGLRRAADVDAPDLGELVRISRSMWLVTAVVALAAIAIVMAVVFGIASAVGSVELAWATGGLLAVLLILTWVLCAHAGGHAWLVPVPALALAVLWALTAASGKWSSATTWWMAVASAAMSAGAVLVGATALRQRIGGVHTVAPPVAGTVGSALTALSPTGVVRVAGETWTAESLSGPLPAGAPVHVVKVRGLRLMVWSEVGTVPTAESLHSQEESQ